MMKKGIKAANAVMEDGHCSFDRRRHKTNCDSIIGNLSKGEGRNKTYHGEKEPTARPYWWLRLL
jgi:hypothetical protein